MKVSAPQTPGKLSVTLWLVQDTVGAAVTGRAWTRCSAPSAVIVPSMSCAVPKCACTRAASAAIRRASSSASTGGTARSAGTACVPCGPTIRVLYTGSARTEPVAGSTKKWSTSAFSWTTPSPMPYAAAMTQRSVPSRGSRVNATNERSPGTIRCTPTATRVAAGSRPRCSRYRTAAGLYADAQHSATRYGRSSRPTYRKLSLRPANGSPAPSSPVPAGSATTQARTATSPSGPTSRSNRERRRAAIRAGTPAASTAARAAADQARTASSPLSGSRAGNAGAPNADAGTQKNSGTGKPARRNASWRANLYPTRAGSLCRAITTRPA